MIWDKEPWQFYDPVGDDEPVAAKGLYIESAVTSIDIAIHTQEHTCARI